MPNFSVSKQMVASPVWVENPTKEPLTWRYNSEYTTFPPGLFRNLETGEIWVIDVSIAVHFKKSLPALIIHTVEPKAKKEVEIIDVSQDSSKPRSLVDMSMQELRHLGKARGMKFRIGMKKEEVIAELEKSA